MAAGEPLPLRQEDLAIRGHAFEARLYAEDCRAGLPAGDRDADASGVSGGRAGRLRGAGGDAISPWYDPMIAKLVSHGPTRAIALARLARGAEATRVAGSGPTSVSAAAGAAPRDFARARSIPG